ncbi:uncharacterized protein [Periplaneta americana]|uniref:uncharacterized protein n=1 Tax=Periplaneta americana TaxID=6978 RepID=UPI0037E94BD1
MKRLRNEGPVKPINNCPYECFGWWLPDILPDLERPSRSSKYKDKEINAENGSYRGLQDETFVREESTLSNRHSNQSDVQIPLTPNDNNMVCKLNSMRDGNRNKIQSGLLTIARSNARHRRSQIQAYAKPNEGLSLKREHLATPNSKQVQVQPRGLTEEFTSKTTSHGGKMLAVSRESHDEHMLGISRYVKKTSRCRRQHSTALSKWIEHDSHQELQEPCERFLQTVSSLNAKLRELESNARQLHADLSSLRHDFQSKESAVMFMIEETKQLEADLQELQYLDDLIFLLQGQLHRITLRKWPFILAHVLQPTGSPQELNLVV